MKSYTNPVQTMSKEELKKLADEAKMSLDSSKIASSSLNNGTISTGTSHSHLPYQYYDYDSLMKGWTTTAQTHSHSIYNIITAFSESQFYKNIVESGLSPFELLLETYKSHSKDAFFDAFMHARDMGIVDESIFNTFVFEKKQHALYISCPEFQTLDGSINIIAEVKSPHIVAYLRKDIRESAEFKREINVMKLKGYFE